MNSLQPFPRKRKPPLVPWSDQIAIAKRRTALLNLLVDEGSCPVAFCRAQIPGLTKEDIKEMVDAKWIGAYVLDGALYIRDVGRALLSAPEQSAGEGGQ